MPGNTNRSLTIWEHELVREPEIGWPEWAAALLLGYFLGATLDLFALWLFAHCVAR